LLGFPLPSRFAHDARSQEHKTGAYQFHKKGNVLHDTILVIHSFPNVFIVSLLLSVIMNSYMRF
jgi:hypothetical protein